MPTNTDPLVVDFSTRVLATGWAWQIAGTALAVGGTLIATLI